VNILTVIEINQGGKKWFVSFKKFLKMRIFLNNQIVIGSCF